MLAAEPHEFCKALHANESVMLHLGKLFNIAGYV